MTTPASYRKRAQLTQEQLARALGISVPFLSRLENGKRGFTLETFDDWADACHIKHDEWASVAKMVLAYKK